MFRIHHRGFTLVEVLIAALIGSIGVFTVAGLVTFVLKADKQAEEKKELLVDIAQLTQQIIKVGRAARPKDPPSPLPPCQVLTGATAFFECRVAFAAESGETAPITKAKFLWSSAQEKIDYQLEEPPGSGILVTKTTYGGPGRKYVITAFDLCGPTEMTGGTPTCISTANLVPSQITQRYAVNAANVNWTNRLYRFRIVARPQNLKANPMTFQSAVYVRNPIFRLDGAQDPGLFYQWTAPP